MAECTVYLNEYPPPLELVTVETALELPRAAAACAFMHHPVMEWLREHGLEPVSFSRFTEGRHVDEGPTSWNARVVHFDCYQINLAAWQQTWWFGDKSLAVLFKLSWV